MMMTSRLLSLALLLSLCVCLAVGRAVSADIERVEASSGWNITLKCTANYKPGVNYSAISWYKLRANSLHLRSGLLRSNLNGQTLRYYGVDRAMELLDDSHDIFLPNVTCRDSGVYMCRLDAPVGEQIREGRILLNLTDCPDDLRTDLTDPLIETNDYSPTDSPVHLPECPGQVFFATVFLMVTLVLCFVIYTCTKNTFKDKKQHKQTTKKHIFLDAPLKPLEKKDLMLIYTLGPKTSTMRQIIV